MPSAASSVDGADKGAQNSDDDNDGDGGDDHYDNVMAVMTSVMFIIIKQ